MKSHAQVCLKVDALSALGLSSGINQNSDGNLRKAWLRESAELLIRWA
jgi:hypothetical protein